MRIAIIGQQEFGKAVLEAIDNASAAGLTPVKIDMVVKRGVNDHDIVDMARHFLNR